MSVGRNRLLAWHSAAQVRRQALALVVLQALILAFFIAGTHGWITKGVAPTTTDYASFYAAGRWPMRAARRMPMTARNTWRPRKRRPRRASNTNISSILRPIS
ncbi:MAG: hypothetical protein WDN04_02765 [Rhodospirillales bacterium]